MAASFVESNNGVKPNTQQDVRKSKSLLSVIRRDGGLPLHFAWVLLFLSSVSWFSGINPSAVSINGLAASGGLSGNYGYVKLTLLIAAVLIVLWKGINTPIVSTTICLLAGYALLSLIGAALSRESELAALQASARLIVSVLTAFWIVRRTGLKALLLTTAWLASIICATSIAADLVGGDAQARLSGYWPPMQANDLGLTRRSVC